MGVLQIWLELGLVGIIFFFLLIIKLLSLIFKYSIKDKNIALVGLISFTQFFTVSQLSFGLWQCWWLAVILTNLILYNFFVKNFKSNKNKLTFLLTIYKYLVIYFPFKNIGVIF